MTEPASAPAAAAGRGRPRPGATIDRDEKVYRKLVETREAGSPGATRAELVDALGTPEGDGPTSSFVYLALYRLRKAGRIDRVRDGGRHLWRVKPTE